MRIRCWGARGSVPVCGKQFLKTGGDTTCLEVRTANNELLIVDAGTGLRGLGHTLVREGVKQIHLLLTHMHMDHVFGFPYFRPLYDPDVTIDIYGRSFFQQSLETRFKSFMEPPYFPVHWDQHKAHIVFHEIHDTVLQIHNVEIDTIPLSHPDGGLGYKFSSGRQAWVLLTDNELSMQHPLGRSRAAYVEFIKGSDLLIHDGEYSEQEAVIKRSWGHSAAVEAVQLALDAGVPRIGLIHHNQDRTDDQVCGLVQDGQKRALSQGSTLSCFAVCSGQEILI